MQISYFPRSHRTGWDASSLVHALVALSLFLLFPPMLSAKSVRDLWVAMPDSLVPCLTSAQRADMVDPDNMRLDVKTENLLKGESWTERLTDDFLSVRLSEASSLQMKLLPSSEGDSVLCVVRTFMGPEPESDVRVYDQSWRQLSVLALSLEDCVCRPDTMSSARYDELMQMLDPCLLSAELSTDTQTLMVKPYVVAVTSDEREKLSAILVQKVLKWDGLRFK